MAEASIGIRVKVELFGTLRLRSGRREVALALTGPADRQDVIYSLAEACPTLVGHGLRVDLSDVEEGYAFNRNGLAFLGDEDFTVEDGDCLLLISSQAGG